jgi:SH3-like domain-containing protein
MPRVARDYTTQYLDPITVRAGDQVQVGRDDPEFPGWRWCTAPDGRAGWVPEDLLRRDGATAIVARDYTARELDVRAGLEVTLGEAMHGWAWATDADERSGWIPLSCLAQGSQPERL